MKCVLFLLGCNRGMKEVSKKFVVMLALTANNSGGHYFLFHAGTNSMSGDEIDKIIGNNICFYPDFSFLLRR